MQASSMLSSLSCQLKCTFLSFKYCRRAACFSCTISMVSWAAHWKGVKGLGTNTLAEAVTRTPLLARCSLGTR